MYRASLLKDNEMWFDPKARKGQDVIFNAECLQLTDKFYYIHSALSGKPQFTHDCPILMMYFVIRNRWKCRFLTSKSISTTGMI